MKRHPTKRSPEARRTMLDFRADHLALGKRCWLCGENQATEPHHIVHRRGDEYDDARNLAAVCWFCHKRIHDGETVAMDGRRLPAWKLEDVLRAKRRHDPDNYDPEFLDRLAHPERTLREFFNVKEPQ